MGLSPSDAKPENISIADAYSAIRTWYQNHVSDVVRRDDDYGRRSAQLIRHLLPASQLSDLEQRAVLREVVCALLQWGYDESDGKFKMGAYADAALETAGRPYYLSTQEREQLKTSRLSPYLSPDSIRELYKMMEDGDLDATLEGIERAAARRKGIAGDNNSKKTRVLPRLDQSDQPA